MKSANFAASAVTGTHKRKDLFGEKRSLHASSSECSGRRPEGAQALSSANPPGLWIDASRAPLPPMNSSVLSE
ncbi:uncharacterized protein SOCE836_099110 [Sorangium cellulosum]|uniref:Uncharacterized protein n=1 Tax=Sorangium cellulosum TaxID=56 RepID=A0A4P2R4W3_SORCE|nr:uncharacterized protein SOCE836_099110 [Sorangium cellulosum]WCQ96970.1 hypothetical protein NQZ70_09760 [Sorangium sp. Soce836]